MSAQSQYPMGNWPTGPSEASRPRNAPQQQPYRQQHLRQQPGEDPPRGAWDTRSDDDKRDQAERPNMKAYQEEEQAKQLKAHQEGHQQLDDRRKQLEQELEQVNLQGEMLDREKEKAATWRGSNGHT
jgi:hypothetical protein